MKFNHLNVPTHWQNYWTRYPEGHTILEALISWVSQVDSMVDNQNNLNGNVAQFRNEIDEFIGRFDERLQTEVTQTLSDWQNSGFLDVVISSALQWQLDDYIATNEQDKLSINQQLAQHETNFNANEENEGATISDNELVNGTGWTLGQGWSGNFTVGFTHETGNTEPLTYTLSNIANKFYQIEVTVQSPSTTKESNSGWTMSVGGSTPFEMYEGNFTEHTYVRGIKAGTGNSFVIDPVTQFDGTIKNVSIKEIVGEIDSTFEIKDKDGQVVFEITPTNRHLQNVYLGVRNAKNNTTGHQNVGVGYEALMDNTSGFWNVAVGLHALRENLTGSRNVAVGRLALAHNEHGHRNIAIGPFVLQQNKNGHNNIGIGADAMQHGENSSHNIAIGLASLTNIENGSDNIAMGQGSGVRLQGNLNIALGRSVLNSYTGDGLVAIGAYALASLETGTNTAIGLRSLMTGKEINNNTAVGYESLRRLGDGIRNTVIGHQSAHKLLDGSTNTAIGYQTLANLTTGNSNTVIGHSAGARLTTGSTNILLDSDVINAEDSNKLNLGNLIYSDRTTNRTYIGRRKEPTAILELREGTGSSGGAPLKFNNANLLSSPEAGTFEFYNGELYFTGTQGQRKKVVLE